MPLPLIGYVPLRARGSGSTNVALGHSNGCYGKGAVEGGSAGAEEVTGGLSEEHCRGSRGGEADGGSV